MAMKILLVVAIIVAAAAAQYYPAPPQQDRQTLRFRVSARNLPDKDKLFTIDPYIKLYGVDGDSTSEYKVGRTDTLSNTRNPDFPNVFTFKFDRSKNQRLHIRVFDHDNFRRDDKAGETWISLNEYMDRGQRLESNLNKKGYVIIQRA